MLRLPEGGAVLIDGGAPARGPRVVSLLREMGINRLDALLITHFHPDHAGGLDPVLDQFLPISSKQERAGTVLLPLFPKAVEPEVQTVRPQRAILSVGPNPYGLPKEEVVEMYRRVGARLHRTDEEGTITVISDGRSVRVQTERSR